MKRKSVGIILLTVLIDLVGFGLILPLIPIYADNFKAGGFFIAVIVGCHRSEIYSAKRGGHFNRIIICRRE